MTITGLTLCLLTPLLVANSIPAPTEIAKAATDRSDDPMECGPNALFLLLQLTGHRVGINEIHRVLPSRPDGNSMTEIQSAARAFGLDLKGVRFDRNAAPLDHPAIAFMDRNGEGHYVVLRPVGLTGKRVQIIDPPFAPMIRDYERLIASKAWTGRILLPYAPPNPLIVAAWIVCLAASSLVLIAPLRRKILSAVRPILTAAAKSYSGSRSALARHKETGTPPPR